MVIPGWTPGSSAALLPFHGEEHVWMSPAPIFSDSINGKLWGREFKITFDTKKYGLLGDGITQNMNGQAWANLHCAFCPLEQFATYIHSHHRDDRQRLLPYTARDNENLPQPCVGVAINGITHFSLFVALPDWNKICHFDVEVMHGGMPHAYRRRIVRRLRYMPGVPTQFVD